MSSKSKAKKSGKSSLSEGQKKIGKQRIYILVGMIVVSLAFVLYSMHT